MCAAATPWLKYIEKECAVFQTGDSKFTIVQAFTVNRDFSGPDTTGGHYFLSKLGECAARELSRGKGNFNFDEFAGSFYKPKKIKINQTRHFYEKFSMIEKRIAMGRVKFLAELKECAPFLVINGRETDDGSNCLAMFVIKAKFDTKREKYFHLVVNFSRDINA